MTYLNVYQAGEQLDNVPGYGVTFNGLPVEEKTERRSYLQSIVSTLCDDGFGATVAPKNNPDDIIVVGADDAVPGTVLSRYSDFRPEVSEKSSLDSYVLGQAWKDFVRTRLLDNGFFKIGGKYVKKSDIFNKESEFKDAFRIQADLVNNRPSLFVDPRTRIMNPLTEDVIETAEREGEESEVSVQLLPWWKQGFLLGRTGAKAGDNEFTFRGRDYATPEYWERRHGIEFVDEDEELVDVYVPDFDDTAAYPVSCIFESFQRGTSLPSDLRKGPDQRVTASEKLVGNRFTDVEFAGHRLEFGGPVSTDHLGYRSTRFGREYEFEVALGGGNKTSVDSLHKSLKRYGPYAGEMEGKYVVIAPEDSSAVREGFDVLENIYTQLSLGNLERATSIGDDGIVSVEGIYETDYTSTITNIRSELDAVKDDFLAFVVLPGENPSNVYYKARGKLFERLFGNNSIPAQAIQFKNVVKLANENGYFLGVNTAAQAYVKLGRIGSAVWVLDEPADSHIPGVDPGSTCYAYHDVSRRPKKKASATAYSAMTDSYGRYIATGTKPTGGEELTPLVFHEVMVELLQKVSAFNRRFATEDEHKQFAFRRLLFAKDGYISWKEEQMMRDVVRNGVPEEGKRPLARILDETDMLPEDLVLDIIGVNKSPNKRVFERKAGNFQNVSEGTAVTYDDESGLLVSFETDQGTAQPMEISLKDHVCLNKEDTPAPTAEQLLKEYYHMSYLNWSSVFKQGKYALPQILTQNLGENLSAGIETPENMAVI